MLTHNKVYGLFNQLGELVDERFVYVENVMTFDDVIRAYNFIAEGGSSKTIKHPYILRVEAVNIYENGNLVLTIHKSGRYEFWHRTVSHGEYVELMDYIFNHLKIGGSDIDGVPD